MTDCTADGPEEIGGTRTLPEDGFGVYAVRFLRARTANPAMPVPTSSRDAGSGTAAVLAEMLNESKREKNQFADDAGDAYSNETPAGMVGSQIIKKSFVPPMTPSPLRAPPIKLCVPKGEINVSSPTV